MAFYLLQVSSRAIDGRDDDYDQWYGDVHVGEVLGVPGFKACQRYKKLGTDHASFSEFVAMYEVETDNPVGLLGALNAAAADMRMTDAIDIPSVRFEFLFPHGDRETAN